MKAVRTAELDKNHFWKLLQSARKGHIKGVSAIRRPDSTVVHELRDVLEVWATHFAKLGTPKESDSYDRQHFIQVSDFVKNYDTLDDHDEFLNLPFTYEEIHVAIKALHPGKSPGFDGIATEHITNAGPSIIYILCDLFNAIREREYIPKCLRRGVQIPLYKGKDTCILDPNNYRGITLLPTFHKMFEILVWKRVKGWWHDQKVISELQGACRGGFSCVHTAFMLSETVATSMETADKCFVAYFDVAKAFDTLWIDGLFQQIHDLGRGGSRDLLRGGARLGGDLAMSNSEINLQKCSQIACDVGGV